MRLFYVQLKKIVNKFSRSEWKKLMIKYHPDKNNNDDKYSVLLNSVKDFYEPIDVAYDETWIK